MYAKYLNVSQKQLRGFGIVLPDVVSRQGGSDEMVARVGLERVRMWRKTLLRSGEAFEGNDLERIADRPREVLSYATYLLEVARERAARLPFGEVMIADLESHLVPANNAWQAVHLGQIALKGKQRDVRSKGQALWRAVMQLRAMLEPKLGTDHPDCLVLKATRTRASVEEDDVDETASASQGNGAAVPATSASG